MNSLWNTPDGLQRVHTAEECASLAVCRCECWPGHHDPVGVYFDEADIEPRSDVTVEMDSAVGPRVRYSRDTPTAAINAALPEGWRADYSNQVSTDSGRFSAPLVRVTL